MTQPISPSLSSVEHNFYCLLLGGTFGCQTPLRPLSQWKWEHLWQMALVHGVGGLINDGMATYHGDFFLQIPHPLSEQCLSITKATERNNEQTTATLARLFNLFNSHRLRPILFKGQQFASYYPHPLHRNCGDIDIFFPFTPLAEKANELAASLTKMGTNKEKDCIYYQIDGVNIEHITGFKWFTNPILNRQLQQIVDKEIRCCDSKYTVIQDVKVECFPTTLNLLLQLARISHYILNEGISIKQLLDLALFLREEGEHVEVLKLQGWLKRLHMRTMASVIGELIVQLFHFQPNELPFVSRWHINIDRIKKEIFMKRDMSEWYFTQGKDIFVKTSNSNAMLFQMRHVVNYFRFYPHEMFTNFFASFAHGLSHIEE